MKEIEAAMAEIRSIAERHEAEIHRLVCENNKLAQRNDELCDEVYELQQQLSMTREAAE